MVGLPRLRPQLVSGFLLRHVRPHVSAVAAQVCVACCCFTFFSLINKGAPWSSTTCRRWPRETHAASAHWPLCVTGLPLLSQETQWNSFRLSDDQYFQLADLPCADRSPPLRSGSVISSRENVQMLFLIRSELSCKSVTGNLEMFSRWEVTTIPRRTATPWEKGKD